MINFIKNIVFFILNPITDDWKGGLSLMRLSFIVMLYHVVKIIDIQGAIDWSILVVILFQFIYICFKGEAPQLISKLLDVVGDIKTGGGLKQRTIDSVIISPKEEPLAPKSDKLDQDDV